MKRKFLCDECAYKHRFETPKERIGMSLPDYVYIDGEKWVSWHRPPSKKVKCTECGKKTCQAFEPYFR